MTSWPEETTLGTKGQETSRAVWRAVQHLGCHEASQRRERSQ